MADTTVACAVVASGTADRCKSPAAALNEPTILLRITGGKWKGKLTLPQSATVGDLKCQLAASSKIPEASQQLIFRGKKMLDLDAKVVDLGLKNKSAVYLRLIKQPIKSLAPTDEELQKKAASDLRERLAAQGAGNIGEKTAQQYIELVSKSDKKGAVPTGAVLDAIKLYYKSSGKIEAARNIQSVEAATKKVAAASAASASNNLTAAVPKAAESTEPGKAKGVVSDPQETEPKKKKKKKKKTYKQLMNAVILKRQTSDERRKAHKEYLEKNLGGGEFDKLDKI